MIGAFSERSNLAHPAVRRTGRPTKIDNFLPKRRASDIVFRKATPARRALLVGVTCDFGGGAKRNGVEAIENNPFREMPYFAPPMISMAYAAVAKPFVSCSEMNPSAFPGSGPRRRPKRNGSEIQRRLAGPRGRHCAALRSEGRTTAMAPHAVDIAQNGIGKWRHGSRGGGESIGRTRLSC
jgi:hypothetical protein